MTHPLTPEQRTREAPRHRSLGARVVAAILACVGSAAAHAAIVGIGIITAALSFGPKQTEDGPITFAVKEPEPPKQDEPPPPEPEPEREVERPALAKQAPAPAPAPTDAPPEPEAKAAPLRVVGLSLESTTEGGGGPAFGVGETLLGQTADHAADPKLKAPEKAKVAEPKAPPPTATASANRAASRIPTAKVEYRMPKRKRPRLPAYPATLKTQGIEADVTVMVSLDEKGKVMDAKIITPSPYPEFNEAARSTALSEEFEPALRDGVPVPYTLSYTYRFRIEER